eukprot:1331742-Prymnesium_polylepis.1
MRGRDHLDGDGSDARPAGERDALAAVGAEAAQPRDRHRGAVGPGAYEPHGVATAPYSFDHGQSHAPVVHAGGPPSLEPCHESAHVIAGVRAHIEEHHPRPLEQRRDPIVPD